MTVGDSEDAARAQNLASWEDRLARVEAVVVAAARECEEAAPDLTGLDQACVALLGRTLRHFERVALPAIKQARDQWFAPAVAGTPLGEASSGLTMVFNWAVSWDSWLTSTDAPPGLASQRVKVALGEIEMVLAGTSQIVDALHRLGIGPTANALRGEMKSQTALESQLLSLRLASTRLALEQVELDAAAIAKTREKVSQAAGIVGEGALAETFGKYAGSQRRHGWFWFVFTILLLGVVVWVGNRTFRPEQSIAEIVSHVLIAAPAAGLAAYTARESSRRREAAERATFLSVQLRTIGAYGDQLTDSHTEDLLVEFGRHLYGPYAALGENPLHAVPPELLEALIQAVKKPSASS